MAWTWWSKVQCLWHETTSMTWMMKCISWMEWWMDICMSKKLKKLNSRRIQIAMKCWKWEGKKWTNCDDDDDDIHSFSWSVWLAFNVDVIKSDPIFIVSLSSWLVSSTQFKEMMDLWLSFDYHSFDIQTVGQSEKKVNELNVNWWLEAAPQFLPHFMAL